MDSSVYYKTDNGRKLSDSTIWGKYHTLYKNEYATSRDRLSRTTINPNVEIQNIEIQVGKQEFIIRCFLNDTPITFDKLDKVYIPEKSAKSIGNIKEKTNYPILLLG